MNGREEEARRLYDTYHVAGAGAALAQQRCEAAARDLGACSDDPVVARS